MLAPIATPTREASRNFMSGLSTWYSAANLWQSSKLVLETRLTRENVWFNGHPVAEERLAASETRLTFTDHLGTPFLQTTPTATPLWRAEYEPYGAVWAMRSGTTADQRLRFPGQEFDEETPERSYNIARFYRANWGTYTSADPIGLRGGNNLFAYVADEPIGWADPRGISRTTPGDYPTYEPGKWNDNGYTQRSNNCYSYACNRPWGHPPDSKPQPGQASGTRFQLTCDSIIRAAMADGLRRTGRDGCCPNGYHKVELVIAPDPPRDYHWYREDADGTWSSKPGWGLVTNLDASGNIITDPSKANRNYSPGPNYRIDCGVLCAPN